MVKIVAIDGPASAGKSTLAKKISDYYNSPLLNSGRLYRVIASNIINKKIKISDKVRILNIARSLTEEEINSKNLFSSEIDLVSSKISAHKYLRDQLKEYQRKFPKMYARNRKFAII